MNFINIPGVIFSSVPQDEIWKIKDGRKLNIGAWVVSCNLVVGFSDFIGKATGGRGCLKKIFFRNIYFVIMIICNIWLTVQYLLDVEKEINLFFIVIYVCIFFVVSRNGSNTTYSMIQVQNLPNSLDKQAIAAVFNYSLLIGLAIGSMIGL